MGFSKKPADNRTAADSTPASEPAPEDPPSGSLSFFSRLALPLRSRPRNVVDFHIRPAEPHRKYGAGDQVQGAVILTVVKPVRITHLVVSLHGYMRVLKGPSIPANEPILDPADIPSTPNRDPRQKGPASGCVKLFQDEQPLSGDGKLEPGRYEFHFNLLFPADPLPSSVDFERGTISYMITATLTRPASIGTKFPSKTNCERKVYLVEKVDIGPLSPPRPRTIYLEPISKRPRGTRQHITCPENTSATAETAVRPSSSDLDSTRNENSTEGSLSVIDQEPEHELAGNNNPGSPVQSDVRSVSSESAVSGSIGPGRGVDAGLTLSPAPSLSVPRILPLRGRTITATVELLKGGCLPGDVVPIKISVQHIRRIKSMHGVVATLYRLGRIDSSPTPLSKDPSEGKEEYYPKSKTGLGGLSLSAAGSCSVFRKDLSQAFAPLIIDPDTLSAGLTTSVRVPEDVFPTINGVPFDMISFKYQVEVIVDLGGKLSNQIQEGKPSGTRVTTAAGPLGLTGSSYDGAAASLTSWGTSILDTDSLRRQKGVISVVFELVVGTTDSSRLRGKGPMKPSSAVDPVPGREPGPFDSSRSQKQPWHTFPEDNDGYAPDDYDASPHPHPQPPQPYPYWNAPPSPPPAPHYIPPPDIPDESALSEKERIRRAEQRLLPSRPEPPGAPLAGPSHSSSTAHPASGENIYDGDDQPPSPTRNDLHPPYNPLLSPSAPALEDLPALQTTPQQPHPSEDKQELERRRLLAEASAPPDFPDDYHDQAAVGPTAPPMMADSSAAYEPSAPVLQDEDGEGEAYGLHHASYGGGAGAGAGRMSGAEPLPRYER